MFAHKSVTNASKAIDTPPYSMHNALQIQCSFENMPIIQLVMYVLCHKIWAQIINNTNN